MLFDYLIFMCGFCGMNDRFVTLNFLYFYVVMWLGEMGVV
jgi:hypothetical protein